MPDALTVSHNEVAALAGKAVRGLNKPWSEFDLIGNAVADLEAMGFNGVARLADALPRLAGESVRSPGRPSRQERDAHFNLNGRSAWHHLANLANWLIEQDCDRLRLYNCPDAAAGIALLSHAVTDQNRLEFSFRDDDLGAYRAYRAIFHTPGHPPNIYRIPDDIDVLGMCRPGPPGPGPDKLVTAPDTALLRVYRDPKNLPDQTPDIRTEQLLKRRMNALRTGLSPDPDAWRILHRRAKDTLVPTSVQSEPGAGE